MLDSRIKVISEHPIMDKYVSHKLERSNYNLETANGDYKESLSEVVDIQKAKLIYDRTVELFQWLYTKIR
jgi:hypothetical protein